ncbi:MAG: LysR family transcriptional regulator [Clostridia bacterium]|nr:LysR family transcriptional regulator [Clostridia bacterium]
MVKYFYIDILYEYFFTVNELLLHTLEPKVRTEYTVIRKNNEVYAIMFDQLIHTFIQVAEHKSFSSAAKTLYLSANAVKKRIESLEQQSGLVLFTRTNQGCTLTPAGISLYLDLIEINNHYAAALSKATYIQEQSSDTIFIGIMSTFGETFMTSPWFDIHKQNFSSQLRLVYYAASLGDMDNMFHDVGHAITLCIDVYDEKLSKRYDLCAKKTSSFQPHVGIPVNMELSQQDTITFDQLQGQCIALPPRGRAKVFDAIRFELQQQVSDIRFVDQNEYTVRSINERYMNRQLLLAAYDQSSHYPFYRFVPLDTQLKVDFGIYYRKRDEYKLQEFFTHILPTN